MDNDLRQQAIALYDRFTHEGMDRRLFMRRMTALAGSAVAAEALIGSIAASPAAAAIVLEDDKRLRTGMAEIASYKVYAAEPVKRARKGTILVIHENRGLNAHIKDVARRLALEGLHAVAPDMLSPSGGTPANDDAARNEIGKLDLAAATGAAVAMIDEIKRRSHGKVGAVGFCWGGAFVNRLAVAAGDKLDAGVVYYGPAPNASEAPKVQASLMIHLAGLDDRVAQTAFPWITALRAAGKRVTYFGYDGVNHAFNNDTSAERYNKPAADLAWKRTLRFFKRQLS
ncbi:MAG: dienelactone hydrolase family protein [Sphingomicrobium sp.]